MGKRFCINVCLFFCNDFVIHTTPLWMHGKDYIKVVLYCILEYDMIYVASALTSIWLSSDIIKENKREESKAVVTRVFEWQTFAFCGSGCMFKNGAEYNPPHWRNRRYYDLRNIERKRKRLSSFETTVNSFSCRIIFVATCVANLELVSHDKLITASLLAKKLMATFIIDPSCAIKSFCNLAFGLVPLGYDVTKHVSEFLIFTTIF